MGILDWLFGPWKWGSSRLFNEANQHWQMMKQGLLTGDERTGQRELLEVVRLCQESIQANPQKEGDAYVLLTNTLLRGSTVYDHANKDLLLKYAAACIYSWWTLPYKKPPITSHYDLGLRWYEEVLEELRNSGIKTPEATIAEYGTLHGSLVTPTAGFNDVKTALQGLRQPDQDRQEAINDILFSHWNNTLYGDEAGSQADFSGVDLVGVDLSKDKLIEVYREGLGNGQNRFKELAPEVWRIVMGNLSGSNFSNANLGHAILRESVFSNASFHGANLSSADLSGADLEYAFLEGANFTGANLTNTDLKRADLTDAIGLTQEQVESAAVDQWTDLPDYLPASNRSENQDLGE